MGIERRCDTMPKLGSLFDGIGGFPHSASKVGIKALWASEIEPWPVKVTQKHFPDMMHLGDITKIDGSKIPPVTIITFGSPCQDLSVAGKRAGLEGQRSGLFHESIRVIREMQQATSSEYPRFLVFENVPGLLSSHEGKDFKIVLDELQNLGFILDPNILDAQYMGVPQRRRRVFIACVSVGTILQKRTILSAKIILQLLTECLLIRWVELTRALGRELENLDFRTRNLAEGGLQKRIKLFSLDEDERLNLLLMNLRETLVMYLTEQNSSVSNLGVSLVTEGSIEATRLHITPEEAEVILASDMFTLLSWRTILGEDSQRKSESTTSTATSETIESKIYSCAEMLLNIAKYTILLNPSCQNLLSEESLISTGLEECTNYARQTNDDLFADMEWVLRWGDYIKRVSDYRKQIKRYFGGTSASEILFVEQGLRGDFTESGETGQGTARDAGEGVAVAMRMREGCAGDGKGPLISEDKSLTLGCANDQTVFVQPYAICSYASNSMKSSNPHSGIYEAVTSRTLDLNGGNPACNQGGIAVCIQGSMIGRADKNGPQGDGVNEEVSLTLNATDRHAVAYGIDQQGGKGQMMPEKRRFPAVMAVDCRNFVENEELSGSLQCKASGGYSLNYQNPVRVGYAVRRLTPLECLRLQGYPDWWLDIEGMSDTAKYKAIGNSLAIPCSDFVMAGIVRAIGGSQW